MRIPKDVPVGSVIAYEYLWSSQAQACDDGAKVYPVALVMAKVDVGPQPLAYALGMSHKPPTATERALLVPKKLQRHLGLDDAPAWIYTDQVNVFAWPGPDLRPASWLSSRPESPDSCVIGVLPGDWFATVTEHMLESYRLRMLRPVKRS